eukprot:gene10653-7583_t
MLRPEVALIKLLMAVQPQLQFLRVEVCSGFFDQEQHRQGAHDILDDLDDLEDPYDTIIPNPGDGDGDGDDDAAAPDAELLRVLSLGVPSTPAVPRLQQHTHVPASSEPGKASALVAESTKQKLFARFASTLSRGGDDDVDAAAAAAADGESEAAPVLSASEAKAILAQKPSEAASADERRTQKLQQKIAEANLSRHELIALKRKQKMERLRGINPYFDPTLSLRNSRQNRSQVTAGKATFREYHSGLVASLTHALVARQHMNSKPDLTEAELKHFHRPRMTHRDLTKRWQIGLLPHSRPAQTRERSRRHVSAVHAKKQTLALAPGAPHHSHGSSAAKRSQTEALQSDGANSTFILVEYAEEFPPVVQNYGMASLLVNFYRPSKGQGAGDDDDPSGASEADRRAEEEASLQRMTALLARHKLRLPSHVSQLWRLQHNKEQRGRYDHDADIPRLELGQTKLLNPDDESPFLGWDTRDTLQPALVNRLFRTPLFPQQVRPTDFLLVRSRVGAEGFEYVLREIPFAFAAGQVEPLRLVPRPPAPPAQAGDFSVTVLPTQRLHYALAIVRILKASEDGVSLGSLQKAVLKFSGDEKRAPHKAAHRELVKDLATRVLGEFRQTDAGDARLFLREAAVLAEPPRGEETLLGGDAAAGGAAGGNSLLALSQRVAQVLERYFPHGSAYGAPCHYHPDRLAHAFDAEDVCVVEASAAAEFRMRAQHLLPLDLGFLQHYLHFHSRVRDQLAQLIRRVDPDGGPRGAAGDESLGGRAALQLACGGVLQRLLRRAERHLSVARCLRERLVQMPWSTSEALASCVVDRALNTAALFFDPTHSALAGGDGAQLSARLTLQAQHGLNAPYAAMPVGCLGHFPYHSNHPQQPRVLDVQSLGDPSGLGEAFALKRYVHVNSRDVAAQLWQQLRDSSASASASAAAGARKEDKGLYGTDKDMRRLTKAEAIVILVAFGIDHAKASAMARWDRIHVIREYVQQAEKEGRQIEAFSKYLRDDRASSGGGYGLRRVRRQGANEFGRFGSREHYEGVCREVWRRMARALSSDDWRSSRDEPLSLEQQRRLRRQQRRERLRAGATAALAALVEDSDEDEDEDDEDLKFERDQRRLEQQQQRAADADAANATQTQQPADAAVDPGVAERARKRELRRLKREAKERRKQRVREGAMTAAEAEAAFAAEVAEIAAAAASSKAKGAKGDGDAAVGAKRAAAAEGDEDDAEDAEDDDDDADDMMAMLLARKAGGAARASAGGPAPKRPRVEAAQDEAAELRALSQSLATSAAPTTADDDDDEDDGPVAVSHHDEARRRQQQAEAENAAAEARRREMKRQLLQSVARPQKVVRRIERSYLADGRCVVTVRFVFDQAAVLRVEAAQAAQQSLRIARRLEPQKMEAHVWRRLRVLQNASGASTSTAQPQALQLSQGGVYVPGQGLVAQVYAVNDYDEEHVAGGFGGSALGGALSLSLHRPADDDAFAFSHAGGGGGGRGRRGRGSHSHGHGALGSPDGFDDGGHDVQVGEEEVARLQQSMTSSRRHKSPVEKIQNARLPHVTLAALLETEIMRLWTQPIAELFRWPVDTDKLPNYLSVVAQPIALSDMRHRAVSFQYSSARELTSDVAQMVGNAEAFNGRESPIAKNARKLLTTLQANLQHHATIFGPHGDVYALLEMLLAKQRAAADAKASS